MTSYPHTTKNRRRLNLFDLTAKKNPVVEQIVDSSELTKFFRDNKFIPFAGTDKGTGHTLLQFLLAMRNLSDTNGSCIETMKTYCFGGKIAFEQSVDVVFDTGTEHGEISTSDMIAYAAFLKMVDINIGTYKDLAETLFDSYKTTGNAYVTVTLSQTLGQKKATVSYYSSDRCLYYATKVGEAKVIAISNKWTDQYLRENPPVLVPLFPNFATDELGNQVTMFHLKDGNNEWYGRPDSFQSFQYQYHEFINSQYLINQTDNGFTGKVLLEFESDDPEHSSVIEDDNLGEFDSVGQRFNANFTNASDDPSSVIISERPYGAKQVFVHEFKPNTNENYFDKIGTIAKNKIIAAHQMTVRMLGDTSGSGMSGNAAMDDLKMRLPIIEGYQTMIATQLNQINRVIENFYEEKRFEGISIKFVSPYVQILEDLKAADANGQGANIATGGAQQL